jgi:molybdopterin/thiamine biosynthesis adenylyltransferase
LPATAGERYGTGASFVDLASGIRLVGHTPARRPDLWRAYLDGAEARYRHHGVHHALERNRVEDGTSTSLFWVAIDHGCVVAGLRCHGPIASTGEAAALRELASHSDLALIEQEIRERMRFGVVEIKGVWVALARDDHRQLSSALARCYVHSLEWLDARFALCTASDHALDRWVSTGGRQVDGRIAVPYPDDRYRTVMMWWDRERVGELAEPEQLAAIAVERIELQTTAEPLRARYGATTMAGAHADTASLDELSKPVVLDPARADDMSIIERHLADPMVVVLDTLSEQLSELDAVMPTVPPELRGEGPRWVWYPWRSTMVRVLGPQAFRRVRLDRNRNKITLEEQEALGCLKIGVVGLSVGHVIAHTLALEGLCGELRLADFDSLELSNLNRIPATILDLSLNKAIVASRRIAEVDPYIVLKVTTSGVAAATIDAFLDGLDVVIEECDSLDVKLLVREAARVRRIPVIMETSDRGMLDVERFDIEPHRPSFHGLVEDLQADAVADLSTHDKVPFVLRILEPDQLSARMAASMAEIDETLGTWPQLAGDVTLGGATVAAAVRSLGRGEELPSGRVRVDLQGALRSIREPRATPLIIDIPPSMEPSIPDDFVEMVAAAANLAPSGGNTQPWRFEADELELRFHLVRERTSTLDLRYRGSYVAIGAALFNARVAAAARGRLGHVEIRADATPDDLVARLHFGTAIDLTIAELFPGLWRRRSNRHHGTPGTIPESAVASLQKAVEAEGARLTCVVEPSVIETCAALLAESDRLRNLSPWLHQEMMSELRWPGYDDLSTGIDVRTLELDSGDIAKLAVARRADIMEQLAAWNAGRALGDITRARVRSSGAIAVVTVDGEEPGAYVRAGAAVERLWLEAEQLGLAVQPVSPVFIYATEEADYRALMPAPFTESLAQLARSFREALGITPDTPLGLVLRLHYAPAPTFRSARLPIAEVLTRKLHSRANA